MAIIESQNYIDALKRSKSKEIKVASYDRKEFIKKQGNKCSKCKRDLRAGYYKISVDPKTKEILTEHTTNPVPCIIIKKDFKDIKLKKGKLADVAPTLLHLQITLFCQFD